MNLLRQRKIQLVIITVFTILTYSNIFHNQLAIDDIGMIQNWTTIRSYTNIPKLLHGDLPLNYHGNYRPIRSLLYVLYYHLFGANPVGYHLHSLVVHLLSTVLVFLIVEQLLQQVHSRTKFIVHRRSNYHEPSTMNHQLLPFLTALLFGLHPIHTEAITYIAASMDTTGVVFFLSSFYFYLKTQNSKLKTKYLILSYGFAFFSIYTYEMTAILPLFIVLYEVTLGKLGKLRWLGVLKRSTAYFLPILLYIPLRLFLARIIFNRGGYIADDFYHTMVIMPKMFVWYMWLLIWPVKLSYIHTIAPGLESYMGPYSNFHSIVSKSFFSLDILASIVVLLLLIIVGIFSFRKNSLITFCIFWFLISLLPVSYLVPVGPAISERYTYVGSFAYLLLFAYGVFWAKEYLKRQFNNKLALTIFWTIAILISGFYAIRTYMRNKDWYNSESVYKSIVDIYPTSLIARYYLSSALVDRGEIQGALKNQQAIIDIEPRYWEARYNLANSYYKTGNVPLAEQEYKKTIQSETNFLDAYIHLANLYRDENKIEEAMYFYEKALHIDPRKYRVFNNYKAIDETYQKFALVLDDLGRIYEQKKELVLAAKQYSLALDFYPDFTKASDDKKALLNKNTWILPILARENEFEKYEKNGVSFAYPPSWSVNMLNSKSYFIKSDIGGFTIVVKVGLKPSDISNEEYISLQTVSYGELVNKGLAQIPAVEIAYVKIWQEKNILKHQFFLFKGDTVVELLVYPSNSSLMKKFDKILESFKIV